jgi:hypothetical protein
MLDFIQQSWSGGLNQQLDSTRLSKTEYALLINGRNRYDIITPVKLPDEIEDPLLSLGVNFQGIYSAGSLLIVFVDGLAYWKNYNLAGSNYTQIAGFLMDANEPIIYAELVPTSYSNYTRIPTTANQKNTDVKLVSLVSPSPQGLVCQDGKNNPWIIDSALGARELSSYSAWTLNNREYVPIGKQMLWFNGILYIVSANGTKILRSVTGRPLDFMVNITAAGDKEPAEQDGGADSVSHSVDFEPITSINRLITDDGSFFVSTNKASYAVTPLVEPEDLIFGEPSFANRFLFSAGSTSPFSFIEMLGDNAFVDFNGLRSFNAVLQLKNEGKNSPFSKKVGPILQSIVQDYTAAATFDNYALFGVNTIYGRGILVFDTLGEIFVGLDIYPNVGQIKKFEEVKTATGRKLFFITIDNKLYEAFGSEDTANCQLYIGDWCSNDPNVEQKPFQLKLVFIDCKQDGTVHASNYTDKKLGKELDAPLAAKLDAFNPPIIPPFGQATADTVQILAFDFSSSAIQGWKHGFFISWDIDASLSHARITASEEPNVNSVASQATTFKRNREILGL